MTNTPHEGRIFTTHLISDFFHNHIRPIKIKGCLYAIVMQVFPLGCEDKGPPEC